VPGDESRGHGACGGLGAAADPSGKSWSYEARGGPGAGLCQVTGAEAMGHVAVPELLRALVAGGEATRHVVALKLPCARRWEPQAMCARLVFRL
jgi:hypothetical protein